MFGGLALIKAGCPILLLLVILINIMPTIISNGSRIRTNISAELAYNFAQKASSDLAQNQLRISTGQKINSASDDVSGFITAGALTARNGALKSALRSAGEAINVVSIAQDSYDNINQLLSDLKNSAATASNSSLGTDEIVSLGKASYRLAQQIQFVVDSSVFSGKQLLYGNFSAQFNVGNNGNNDILSVNVNLSADNADLNVESRNFKVFSIVDNQNGSSVSNFAGVSNLDLSVLNNISNDSLGIFANDIIKDTITSLSDAIQNISNVGAYLGGVQMRLESQNEISSSQIVNYNSAISRIKDSDIAQEQLNYSKNAFLQNSALNSLTQANLSPFNFFRLFTN